MPLPPRLKIIVLWLVFGSIAAGSCALFWPAAHLDNEYLPVSNDSFYHARRILDTAANPASFYEFDKRIHAPEGSLLTWPWGYDYVMGLTVRAAGQIGIPGPPIAFLIWIPVVAVFVSVGLVMLIARRLSLSVWSTGIAGVCVALSPLTQLLHGVGMVDHHFAEYIFVLATVACGLSWFLKPEDSRSAVILGLVLGVAPAVHNGLFVLQIPVLATLLVFWLQGVRLPHRTTAYFCGSLLAATVAILIPSVPAQLARFEFYTLSLFHLYVASSTAIVTALLARLPRSHGSIGLLTLVAIILLAPLGQQMFVAQSFLAGTLKRLDAISEMRSVRQIAMQNGGVKLASTLYSLLIWLAPLAFVYCLLRSWAERTSGRLFFWICAVCGLSMLTMQFRLHYFGSFALYLPWLIFTERLVARWPHHRRKILLTASLAVVVMYSVPLRYFQLAGPPDPAVDPSFPGLRPILSTLQKACAEDPGIVLADNDAGHYIRYYTECSVIANNFLLTRQHEEKIEEIDYLTSLSAAELPKAAPYVRYILLRPVSLGRAAGQDFNYVSFSPRSAQLIKDLLLRPNAELPKNYTLLNQASLRDSETHQNIPYIRLFKVPRQN